jgi:phasin
MTTETNSVLNTVKEAFAPVTEAFTKLQNMEVPEAARDFVKKQAEKVTAAIETAVSGSVTEAAKITRNIQQALYQDAEAFFAGIDKLASAKSLNEAVQIQSDMVRARGEVFVSRAKASTEYLGKLVADGAKSAQDNFSKVYSKTA